MILNRQRRVPIGIPNLEGFLARARRALHLPADAFGVCFVTDATIARWNLRYRGEKRATDVLSFPADDRGRRNHQRTRKERRKYAGSSNSYLGDIAIAPAVALRNARRYGRTLENEIRILILHGVLHLLGYDHESDTGQMDRREQRLRRALRLA